MASNGKTLIWLGILLASAIAFHGLTNRYALIGIQETWAVYRIDKFTGKVSFCEALMGCYEVGKKPN